MPNSQNEAKSYKKNTRRQRWKAYWEVDSDKSKDKRSLSTLDLKLSKSQPGKHSPDK